MKVRVSGDFHYDPEPGRPAPDLLLVGGGVGINPLHSIMSHVADLNRGPAGERTSPGRVQLLYSAQTQDELLFRVRLTSESSTVYTEATTGSRYLQTVQCGLIRFVFYQLLFFTLQ